MTREDLMDSRIDRILAGLMLLRRTRADVCMNPCLSEDEVIQFETKHRIELPDEYRRFLTEVGNGGYGPHKICRLGQLNPTPSEDEWDWLVGDLHEPFPHTIAWNDLSGTPKGTRTAPLEEEEELERQWEAWLQNYWRKSNVNGAIPICDLGCLDRIWLIVNGPERGNLWVDSRGSEGGIYPLELNGKPRVTFLNWYCDWLDQKVEALNAK